MSLPFRFRLNRNDCKSPNPPGGGMPEISTCKELFATPEQRKKIQRIKLQNPNRRSTFDGNTNFDGNRERLNRLKQVQNIHPKWKRTPCLNYKRAEKHKRNILTQGERVQLLHFCGANCIDPRVEFRRTGFIQGAALIFDEQQL